MIDISVKKMFECDVHYGHLKSNWNPNMKKFIFGVYNNIHIIDLDKSLLLFKKALVKLKDIYENNGKILFVGTKKNIKDKLSKTASSCNQFFINNRWLGGTLTNWRTVKKSIKRFKNYNNYKDVNLSKLTKREVIIYKRNLKKIEKNLYGIRNMNNLPDALFIIDVNNEKLAVKESNKLKIPIFAIVDTNSDPNNIDYVIPGNDDSIKSINFYLDSIKYTLINKI